MPQFCRHNRLIQNCPICSREQEVEPRPLVSSGAPRSSEPANRTSHRPRARGRTRSRSPRAASGLTVRRVRDAADDGYRSPLVPGLKSSLQARALAEELAFAQARLEALGREPPGLYSEVAEPGRDVEERAWLAFLIAYLGPLEDAEDPFAAIRAVHVPWAAGRTPDLQGVPTGPRGAHDPRRGAATIDAYRAWAQRAGSQAAAYSGEPSWSAERRFERAYERLALPGLHRDARFELLASLGRLGVFELRASSLQLGGADPVTVAAKRALGIADKMLLERRAIELASACGLWLDALDLGFYNWERGDRVTAGVGAQTEPGPERLERVAGALGV